MIHFDKVKVIHHTAVVKEGARQPSCEVTTAIAPALIPCAYLSDRIVADGGLNILR
jgi:hypothetical protein